MLTKKRTFACFEIFVGMILINFSSPAYAEFDEHANKSMEQRLHSIYEKHYSRPVLNSDWFKMIDAIEEQNHTVKKGDTLWGISSIYFGDGNFWSKLWSVNKNITNPHLILVGDKIRFRAGSFKKAPSVTVEPGAEGAEAVDLAPLAESSEEESAVSVVADYNAFALPESFKMDPPVVPLRTGRVTVEARQENQYTSIIKMTQEIVATEPKIMATVRSVGGNRLATGENNRIVLDRRGEDLVEGSVLTIIDENIDGTKKGYWIKALGRVRVLGAIDRHLWEAEVLEQYGGITTNSLALNYEVKNVDFTMSGSPQETKLEVVPAADKTYWANGDFIFLDSSKGNVNVGDLVRMNNKFAPSLELYQHVGLLKIVSVSPPYATAIVLTSNTVINEDAVSSH